MRLPFSAMYSSRERGQWSSEDALNRIVLPVEVDREKANIKGNINIYFVMMQDKEGVPSSECRNLTSIIATASHVHGQNVVAETYLVRHQIVGAPREDLQRSWRSGAPGDERNRGSGSDRVRQRRQHPTDHRGVHHGGIPVPIEINQCLARVVQATGRSDSAGAMPLEPLSPSVASIHSTEI
jgi:hypothetical protein